MAPETASQLAVKPEEVTLVSSDTAGAAGVEFTVTARVRAVPEPQPLSAVTETLPELEREHPILQRKRAIVSSDAHRLWEIAEPVGVIAGIVPTTNPTSTVIFKSMIALKARNAIVFSPHPSAVKCTAEAARVMNQAAVAAGAPANVISCLTYLARQFT